MVKHSKMVKKYDDVATASGVKERLESALGPVPFVKVREVREQDRVSDRPAVDFLVDVRAAGAPITFLIEVKSQAQPRLVRMAAAELQYLVKTVPNSYGILMAPYFSPASFEICREAGIGCVDFSGNARLSFKNVFIEKTGLPNLFPEERPLRSLFSPKTSRGLRVLFSGPSETWHVERIAALAGISLGLASKVKQMLLAQDWIKEKGRGFVLANPSGLLEEWSKSYSYKRNRAASYYGALSENDLERALKEEAEKTSFRYGLALFSGARKVAPFVRFPRFFAYVEKSIEGTANALSLKKVDSGANVTLLEPYDEGVLLGLQDINGVKVVSDIQLYLDLKSYGGRGEDAARAVYEQRIRPRW